MEDLPPISEVKGDYYSRIELPSTSVSGLVFPRANLDHVLAMGLPELTERRAFYCLLGEERFVNTLSQPSFMTSFYGGKANRSAATRLAAHRNDPKKETWSRTIVCSSTDGWFDEGAIESRILKFVKEVGRVVLINENFPSEPGMADTTSKAADRFVLYVTMILERVHPGILTPMVPAQAPPAISATESLVMEVASLKRIHKIAVRKKKVRRILSAVYVSPVNLMLSNEEVYRLRVSLPKKRRCVFCPELREHDGRLVKPWRERTKIIGYNELRLECGHTVGNGFGGLQNFANRLADRFDLNGNEAEITLDDMLDMDRHANMYRHGGPNDAIKHVLRRVTSTLGIPELPRVVMSGKRA